MFRSRNSPAVLCLIALPPAILMAFRAAQSQETPEGDDELRHRWFALYEQHAESLEVRAAAENVNLELNPAPLLRYTNPVRGVQQHGAIFLWTRQGRPGMIGSVWSSIDRQRPDERKLCYEWHSLLEDELIVHRDGEQLWNSGEPGLKWQTLGTDEPVAASRPLRLTQMRRLVRSLATEIDAPEGDLRLMSQPLYRYPEESPEVIDGGLFAFVMGTDPELFVLLEARSTDGEESRWQVAFAQFTKRPVTISRGSRELWSCGWATPHRTTGRYFLWFTVERLPADLATNQLETAESGD